MIKCKVEILMVVTRVSTFCLHDITISSSWGLHNGKHWRWRRPWKNTYTGHYQYVVSDLSAPHSVDGVVETLLESSSLPLPPLCTSPPPYNPHAHTLQCRTDTKCSKQWLQNSIAGAICQLVTCTFIAFLILPGTSWGGWGYGGMLYFQNIIHWCTFQVTAGMVKGQRSKVSLFN